MFATPDLTRYYLVHEAMRTSARQLAAALPELDLTDDRRIRAVRWWYDGFCGELHAHHTLEDELFFPALAARVPTFAAEQDDALADEHVELAGIMEALQHALTSMDATPHSRRHHEAAVEHADALSRFLDHHLGIEDDDVLPLFARHFTAEEYTDLDDRALKGVGLRQLLFTVPWALTSADDETRARTLAEAPAPMRVIWRLTRTRYQRRTAIAMGTGSAVLVR